MSKVVFIFLPFLLLFLVLTGGYLWLRFLRPKLIIPIQKPSAEQVLIENLTSAGLPFETPFLIQDKTITASVSGATIFFSSTKDLSIQVRSLQLLLPEVTMGKEKVSVIDLRFNKAVMR